MNFSGWFARVTASLVDALIPAPFFLIAGLWGEPQNTVLYYGLIGLGVVLHAYNRWWLAGRTGQSWGRKLLGIRLVGERTSAPIGPARAALRDLAHLLDDFAFYIGYLLPLWTAKRQTVADMVMRTVVLH